MSREDFEKRLCISYLDEAEAYSYKEVSYSSVVSMITSKKNYIDNIEMDWAKLRADFEVEDGVCLHFTDIKALLNPSYFDRNEKNRNLDMEKIFCDEEKNVLTDKLYKFYEEVQRIINENELMVQVTGKRYLKTPMFKDKNIKKLTNGYWYPLFKAHLDVMAYYLIKLSYDEYCTDIKTNRRAKYYDRFTKLRYDGDFDLSVRNEFRDAFNHSMTSGTERFNAKAIKSCFDEIRFIDKSEVGYCTVCPNNCASKLINHAGNEIIDFIAIYAARSMAQEDWKKDCQEYGGKTEEEANAIVSQSLEIRIPDKSVIKPMNVIESKIFIE